MARFLLVLCFVVGACTSLPAAQSTPSTAPSPTLAPSPTVPAATGGARPLGDVVRSSVARAPADPEAAKRAAAATAALGADLYAQLRSDQKNLVFSPYSIALALAMTRDGAAGRTAAEMDSVLHASLVGDIDKGFNSLDQALAKRAGSYPAGFGASGPQQATLELSTADRLFAQRGFDFGQPYLDRIASSYGAGIGVVDYARATEDARRTINGWVADQTKTRIPELVPTGVLNELTRFALVNAIYLKAQWSKPFNAASPAPFHRLDGSTVQVALMTGSTYGYAKGAGYQATVIPYIGGLSMIAIVPDEGAFARFESGLDGARIGAIVEAVVPSTYVVLKLPKFQFRSPSPLKEPLSRLGMSTAFTDRADFSVISPREPLVLQDALHEAFIAVDEKGTEAAAATGFFGGATGGPSDIVELTVDRPFLFVIRDDETGAILFMGRVLDPNQ